ncbi:aminotransferase class V-fold PLP-dependent enzyme [Natroniella acetigena]|uniref:aminotransferase class V-fold PLP-dependent enzyme n=1 Tax=Natroniella acetigena TaxID=52004 RepID=UPI00200B10BB|nr:aminotransferase class V-fold PLP-dependent enzyme [Natroniella acetigena]MCK8826797.1 aminotransferase class V-fold PLP-dependent enzyme [Natroniella acetigena]
MIYLDNAATTFKKPDIVYDAVMDTLKNNAGNPSRGSNRIALAASRKIFESRQRVAEFFNVKNSDEIIFTKNATEASNLILKGLLEAGDHIIISSLEHNAIYRPLNRLQQELGIELTIVDTEVAKVDFLSQVERAIREETKLLAVTHASNLTGNILPVKDLGELAQQKGIAFLVDAAQSAGTLEVNVEELKADFVIFTGHKGFFGPPGVGGAYINAEFELLPLLEGGSGGNSKQKLNPDLVPDKYESGTLNTPAIAGLGAGIEFINDISLENIREHKQELLKRTTSGLEEIAGLRILDSKISQRRVGIVAFKIEGLESAAIGDLLDKEYEIAVRTGLHCAPLAHQSLDSYDQGAVRISFSYFNTVQEVELFLEAVNEITTKRRY